MPQTKIFIVSAEYSDSMPPTFAANHSSSKKRIWHDNTWKSHPDDKPRSAAECNHLADFVDASPGKRKEPMTDASQVRNAIARFDQVQDSSDHEREQAFANIKAAAMHYDVDRPNPAGRI